MSFDMLAKAEQTEENVTIEVLSTLSTSLGVSIIPEILNREKS